MSAPSFGSVGDYTADLLERIAEADQAAAEAFLAACRQDAAANDGLVSVNRVRALLADADIEHHRYSSFWSRFTGKGRPMRRAYNATPTGAEALWEICDGSRTGNDGRPYQLRRWVGDAA